MHARWGAVQLKNAMSTIRTDIKLAVNKPTLTLYWMLLKDHSTKGHSCVYTPHFFHCLKQIRITWLLTDSNPSSHRGRGQWSTSRITSFRSINIPVAISHYLFYLKVMDDRQTQNKSQDASRIFKAWYARCGNYMTNLWLTTKLRICKSTFKN